MSESEQQADGPLSVEVVSAEAHVWRGRAERVSARTVDGEIGILAGHEPVLGLLAPGEVRITQAGGERVLVTAGRGFLSVDSNRVTVVADTATLGAAAKER